MAQIHREPGLRQVQARTPLQQVCSQPITCVTPVSFSPSRQILDALPWSVVLDVPIFIQSDTDTVLKVTFRVLHSRPVAAAEE